MKKKCFLILFGLFLISFVFAQTTYNDCSIYGNCKPVGTTITTGGNYTINVNNTNYFQGYTPTSLKDWIQGLFNSIYCKLTGCSMTGNINMNKNNITNISSIGVNYTEMTSTAEPETPLAGNIVTWVENFKGFPIYKFKDSTGMIFEPEEGVYVGKNEIGSAIPEGSVVYNCGVSGNVPLLCLARANNISTSKAIGITIENIADGSFGRYRFVGILQSDMSAWEVNDLLFLSDTVAGGMTNVPPLIPNLTVELGRVLITDGLGTHKMQVMIGAITGEEFGTINNFIVLGNLTASQNIIISNGTTTTKHWNMYEDGNGTLVWERL